jgi:hypothetical protein
MTTKSKFNDKELYGWLSMHEQGKAWVQKLRDMKEGLVRDMDLADDVQLRKISGAITVLNDILDEFKEHAPKVDGD